MRIHPQNIKLRSNWLTKPFLCLKYRNWLVDEMSLTARLQSRYADFCVQPLSQQRAKPIKDEAALLNLKLSATTNVRDVLLMGNQQPVIYAHSVLPRASIRGDWTNLGKLGNKPLGATLFKNPRVKRTPLRYKKLAKNHALYQKAAKHFASPPTYLWARRSIFSINCAKILVTEVFLPNITHE